jgi:RAT1-interacting protein
MKIPAQIRERSTNIWDGTICITFTAKFLEFLRKTISEDGVYSIKYVKGANELNVSKTEASSFLTPAYIKWKSQ